MTVSMKLHIPQSQFEPIHPGTEAFLYQRRNQLWTSVEKNLSYSDNSIDWW